MYIHQTTTPTRNIQTPVPRTFGLPHLAISTSLNIPLTLMIAIRLTLRAKKTRNALGVAGIGGFCKAIITMLIESCALYAASSLLFIVPWAAGNSAASPLSAILAQTQVRASPRPRFSEQVA